MAKNVADQKDIEEIKKEAPFSQQHEKERDGHTKNDDNNSKQSESELQDRYRDGTSMQGDINRQQEETRNGDLARMQDDSKPQQRDKEGNSSDQDDVEHKYGHRNDGSHI